MVMAGAITYLLVPLALKIALRVGAVNQVRDRDVNTFPIARMGGIAMYGGFVFSLFLASRIPYLSTIFTPDSTVWGIMIGAGVMCAIGVIDDLVELKWYAKLAGEILAAAVMAWFGVQLLSLPLFGVTIGSGGSNLIGTIIAVVLVANAVNFVDGLDGLAAGLVGIGGLSFFIYTYYLTRMINPGDYTSVGAVVMAALVGICCGFLPHNFHQAHIFMGDSGALTLGAIIAGSTVVITGQIDPVQLQTASAIPAFMPILIPICILVIPLIDTFWAVVRRLLRGQSPFHADAGHLHHRLLRRGHSHRNAVLILYMWAAVVSFSGSAMVILPIDTVMPWALLGLLVASTITIWFVRRPIYTRTQPVPPTQPVLSTQPVPPTQPSQEMSAPAAQADHHLSASAQVLSQEAASAQAASAQDFSQKAASQKATPSLMESDAEPHACLNPGRYGRRRSADEIIARASLISCVFVLICTAVCGGAAVWGLSFSSQALVSAKSVGLSISAGSLIVIAFNLMGWMSVYAIPRLFPRVQGIAFSAGFFFKAGVVFLLLALIWHQPWFHMQIFFITFACALIVSLGVIAALVMREQGPDFDIRHVHTA